MRRLLPVLWFCLAAVFPVALAAQADRPGDWRTKLTSELPRLGHRNWILVVDSAYPLETSAGIETVETNAPMLEVVRGVLDEIGRSQHVRPTILIDAELNHVPESDAPGVGGYRSQIGELLKEQTVVRMPHEKLLATMEKQAEQFHVLVLKTTATLPYSSVFIRLDCRYWSDDAEAQLRAVMSQARPE
jgi:D-ribose pyranose/furanose isomerase RbsD